jgi:hypothetical protein
MKLVRYFIYSSAVMLLITSGAKFIGAAGHEKILAELDPIVEISTKSLILVMAIAELLTAAVCLRTKEFWPSSILIAWLATNFLAYRIILHVIGYKKPCSCLGNVTDALHISPQVADATMKIILAYLLVGSYATIFWLWRFRKPG